MATITRSTIYPAIFAIGAWLGAISLGGCVADAPLPKLQEKPETAATPKIDPASVQTAVMDFADRYVSAMADAFDKVRASATTPQGVLAAQRSKLQLGHGAIINAANVSPLAGLMDMAITVTLTRQSIEDPWAKQAFGADGVAHLLNALKAQEADIWRITGTYLTEEQVDELRRVAGQWRRENPDQQYVAGVRLADFPQATQAASRESRLATSVFNIINLDPFAGLDPAVRQVEQSRVLGERMFYYAQHVSFIAAWQADTLYMQMLAAPQMKQLLGDTTRFTDNTSKFAAATSQFADASGQLAKTVERFRADLPEQQAALVKQLDAAVAQQRDAAFKQAAAEITVERQAAIEQLNTRVVDQQNLLAKNVQAAMEQLDAKIIGQQTLMTQNLQAVMDHSIDRLYTRVICLLVMFAAGAVALMLVYRRVTGKRIGGGHRAAATSAGKINAGGPQ